MSSQRSSMARPLSTLFTGLLVFSGSALVACGGDGHNHGDENELITTVRLTLTPSTTGATLTGQWSDPDGDGGANPTITAPGPLARSSTYALTLTVLNESVSPAEDITTEIKAEAEDHLFVFDGAAIAQNLVRIRYADKESDYGTNATGEDLPVGVASTVVARTAGTGALRIRLGHLPPVNGAPVKVANVSLEGRELDVDVTIPITVQ